MPTIAEKLALMHQPASLKSEAHQQWSWGGGTDVWAMLCAAIAGDRPRIESLLEKDPGLLRCSYAYLTPLRMAVRENHRELVYFLIERGAGADYEFGDSLVEIARDRNYPELHAFFESMLRQKYNIVPEGELIAESIRSFQPDQTIALLQSNPALVHAADKRSNKPIHWAVLTRQLVLIDYLLDHGADIHAMRLDGARPIDLSNGDYFYRSWYRDLPPTGLQRHEIVIGYLMARGAYCDISVAARIGYYERVRELLDQDPSLASKTPAHNGYYSGLPLRNAAAAGYLEIVKLLLARGAHPNQSEHGIAPRGAALHNAIQRRHFEIVKLLLEHGADPNAAVESSGNCLWIAKHFGASPELMELIRSYGGKLSLPMILYDNDVEGLRQLFEENPGLEFGDELPEHRESWELALQYQPGLIRRAVLQTTDPVFARWLIDRGLDVRLGDWLGVTPLHRFARDGNIEMATICLEAGADINAIESDQSSTPLGLAARHGRKEMVEWLLSKGADPSLPKDESWALPVNWARKKGFGEIENLLK